MIRYNKFTVKGDCVVLHLVFVAMSKVTAKLVAMISGLLGTNAIQRLWSELVDNERT